MQGLIVLNRSQLYLMSLIKASEWHTLIHLAQIGLDLHNMLQDKLTIMVSYHVASCKVCRRYSPSNQLRNCNHQLRKLEIDWGKLQRFLYNKDLLWEKGGKSKSMIVTPGNSCIISAHDYWWCFSAHHGCRVVIRINYHSIPMNSNQSTRFFPHNCT